MKQSLFLIGAGLLAAVSIAQSGSETLAAGPAYSTKSNMLVALGDGSVRSGTSSQILIDIQVPPTTPMNPLHNGACNVVYWDGHMKSPKLQNTLTSKAATYQKFPTVTMISFRTEASGRVLATKRYEFKDVHLTVGPPPKGSSRLDGTLFLRYASMKVIPMNRVIGTVKGGLWKLSPGVL
jgi:prepilin-type processing-associated H-X9-DG protein